MADKTIDQLDVIDSTAVTDKTAVRIPVKKMDHLPSAKSVQISWAELLETFAANRKDGQHAATIIATANTTINFDLYTHDNVLVNLNALGSVAFTVQTTAAVRTGLFTITTTNGTVVTWANVTWHGSPPQPFQTLTQTTFVILQKPDGTFVGIDAY
jgi:hypothetical protein